MPCKQKALYVKCCIIPNGVTDTQGDTLYAEDIKKIFTSFNNQNNFEIYHNNLPIEDVSLMENYISTADETIGTAVVPSGSWNAVVRVDNPRIMEGLLTGEFGGVSLNNRIAPRCQGDLTGVVRYQDVQDKECVIPLLISFVERGANGYGLHVMDYPAYIQKSAKIGVKKMAFNLLDGLKSLIKEAEASENEEPAIMKEDTEAQEEVTEVTTEPLSEEPVIEKADETEEEEPVIEKADSEEEPDNEEETEEEDEATIEKEDNDLEARVAALEEAIAKLTTEEPEEEAEVEEETETEAEETDEDTPKITKSEKVIVSENVPKQTNYYEMTGRDPITGVKIREQTNILK